MLQDKTKNMQTNQRAKGPSKEILQRKSGPDCCKYRRFHLGSGPALIGASSVLMLGVFVMVLNAWAIDLSVTAMVWGQPLTNGFLMRNPQQVYHVALYSQLLIGLSFALFSLTSRGD